MGTFQKSSDIPALFSLNGLCRLSILQPLGKANAYRLETDRAGPEVAGRVVATGRPVEP